MHPKTLSVNKQLVGLIGERPTLMTTMKADVLRAELRATFGSSYTSVLVCKRRSINKKECLKLFCHQIVQADGEKVKEIGAKRSLAE